MTNLNQAIKQAKHQLEQMIDLTPQVMLLVDRGGMIVRSNAALLQLLDVSTFDRVLRKQLSEVFLTQDGVFASLLEDQSGFSAIEVPVRLKQNRESVVRFTLIGTDNNSEICVLLVDDITEEKEKADNLERKHKTEAVGAVAGALMHHVSQPLTAILARSQLMSLSLESGDADKTQMKNSLQDIVRLTEQIATTLREVESSKDFVMRRYLGGSTILDIERSKGGSANRRRLGLMSSPAVERLVTVLEAHEEGAVDHARRTANGSLAIARRMHMDPEGIDGLRRAAILHDIGKIGVSDALLQKPAPLDDTETSLMRTHADVGYRLLGDLNLKLEAEVARSHHERHDGLGYPRGLSGDRIHAVARVVSVADSFDALTSGRPYRRAEPTEAAVREIQAGAGTQFHPDVVRAFTACVPELTAE